jgi:hypothetical protein
MLINSVKSYNVSLKLSETKMNISYLSFLKGKLGFVIDLTFTSRFYSPDVELKDKDIKYYKIKCSGLV